jgi:hypothetical protein
MNTYDALYEKLRDEVAAARKLAKSMECSPSVISLMQSLETIEKLYREMDVQVMAEKKGEEWDIWSGPGCATCRSWK